jgi:hypothetical protein
MARSKIELLRAELKVVEASFALMGKGPRYLAQRQKLHEKKKALEAEISHLKPYLSHHIPQGATSAVATILRTLRDGTLWTPERTEKTRKDLVRIAETVLEKGGAERFGA